MGLENVVVTVTSNRCDSLLIFGYQFSTGNLSLGKNLEDYSRLQGSSDERRLGLGRCMALQLSDDTRRRGEHLKDLGGRTAGTEFLVLRSILGD
jgi:hypothetical protein